MGAWLKLIMAALNLGGCWAGNGAHTNRCTLY